MAIGMKACICLLCKWTSTQEVEGIRYEVIKDSLMYLLSLELALELLYWV